jgi:tetratricopeptide (TPR) repeat protein
MPFAVGSAQTKVFPSARKHADVQILVYRRQNTFQFDVVAAARASFDLRPAPPSRTLSLVLSIAGPRGFAMTVVGSLMAFGLRQVVGDCADQVVDYTGQFVPYAGPIFTAVRKRLTDHGQALPAALFRANDRAWQAVGLALAGDGLLDRVMDVFRDGDLKGVRDQIKKFLDQTPTGMESASAGVRLKAAEEWRRLRKSGRLSAESLPPDELANQAAALDRYSDPTQLTAAAHRAAADTAAAVKEQAPHLAQLLTAAPPDGVPLLAVAFAFFFRRELETKAELFRGLASDTLRRVSERQERGFAELEESLGAGTGRVLDRLDQLFDALDEGFAAADAKLDDINAKLDQLIDQRDVATSTSKPLKVTVTNKSELELLQSLRDQLRALPPETVAAADWSKLGDTLAAAGQFPEAGEAHQAAAAAAKAAADRTAEAEAEYKHFRDACETGDHMAALTAFRRAVELDPERFTPFDLHRYQPQAVLGAGGFGVVFLADDLYVRVGEKQQPQRVAIKAVHDTGWDAILERDLSETFDEADTLSALNHPGIVKTLNRGFGDPARRKRPYLVLEYFDGPTLDAWLKAKGTLPLAHVLRIARQIAEAVHQAHKRRIYHRDIKPANVMASFDKTTRRWHVKVIDFGLAVKLHVARTSMGVPSGRRTALDRSLAGTLRYAPPEQRNELDADVGPYSDVYAFGKTCLDLLFGTTEPKSMHWKKLPEEYRDRVQDLLERATIDDLEYRFSNFEPVLKKLAELLGEAKSAEKAELPTKETAEAPPVPTARATPTPTPSAAQPRLPVAQALPGQVMTVRIAAPLQPHAPGKIMTVKIPASPNK